MTVTESGQRRTFHFLGSTILMGMLLYWGRPVLIPITIAVLATFVLGPIVARLERWRLPRFIACTVVVLGAVILLVGIGYIFIQQVSALAADLPDYKTQISAKISNLREATANSWLVDVVEFVNEVASEPGAQDEKKGPPFAPDFGATLLPVIQSIAGMTADLLVNAVLVALLTLLMLLSREDLRNRIIQLLGNNNLASTTRIMDEASKRVSRFLLFQMIVNLGFGAVVAISLSLIGIPYAYVWGALAALLRYIPFFGGWIAASFPLLASLVMPEWTAFFLTGAFFVVAEMLQAFLVEPLVFGRSIGVSGAGQLIAMLIWASLWGPIGLVLSTPLTAVLCVMGRHFPSLAFLSDLLGDEEGVDRPSAFYQRLLAGDLSEASNLAEQFLQNHDVHAIYDEMLLPALVSAQIDYKNGELTGQARVAVADAVAEIFADVVMPLEKASRSGPAPETPHVLVLTLPCNDEIDALIAEMLKTSTASDPAAWSGASFKNGQLDGQLSANNEQPGVVLLATSIGANLPRLRSGCKAIHELLPNAKILVACWTMENYNGAASRLRAAGATAISATFVDARQFLGTGPSTLPDHAATAQPSAA